MPFSWSRSGNTNCMSGGHGDSSPAIDALRTSSMTLIYILLSPDRTLRNEPWPQLGDFGDVQRAHSLIVCASSRGQIPSRSREAHENEQALARTRLRLSRRPILDAATDPMDLERAALLADQPRARIVYEHNVRRAARRKRRATGRFIRRIFCFQTRKGSMIVCMRRLPSSSEKQDDARGSKSQMGGKPTIVHYLPSPT
jgi:hypothetical protein